MIFLKSLGATGFEGGYHKQLYPRISTNTSVYEKAVGEEVTLWCDPQVKLSFQVTLHFQIEK